MSLEGGESRMTGSDGSLTLMTANRTDPSYADTLMNTPVISDISQDKRGINIVFLDDRLTGIW